ncbi:MAG: hypothetical protein J6B08_04600 [Ruminiclostridium sp.]|nr:hypothetical protein [Ruminiclostridium sp.]
MKKLIKTFVLLLSVSLLSVTASSEAYETTCAPAIEEPVYEEYEEAILPSSTTTISIESASEAPSIVADSSATGFRTMWDLYQYWYEKKPDGNQYPEYVCGVWSTDGGMEILTVAVTKDEKGEAGKQEILELIENDSSVTFTYASYSFAELSAVRDEILPLMGDDTGIFGLGINEMENCVHIDINTENPNSEAIIKKFTAGYGDMVKVEVSEGYTITMEETSYDIGGGDVVTEAGAVITTGTVETKSYDEVIIFCVIAVFVILLIGVSAIGIRYIRVRGTTAGNINEETVLTKKDTEELVKNSLEEPSSEVLSSVMKKIDE